MKIVKSKHINRYYKTDKLEEYPELIEASALEIEYNQLEVKKLETYSLFLEHLDRTMSTLKASQGISYTIVLSKQQYDQFLKLYKP